VSGKPDPATLWRQAGGDGDKYRTLMLEHGYIRRRTADDPPFDPDAPLLPCGITLRKLKEGKRK
jgi:hypothetical protein